MSLSGSPEERNRLGDGKMNEQREENLKENCMAQP